MRNQKKILDADMISLFQSCKKYFKIPHRKEQHALFVFGNCIYIYYNNKTIDCNWIIDVQRPKPETKPETLHDHVGICHRVKLIHYFINVHPHPI